jgi:hypothetical protein
MRDFLLIQLYPQWKKMLSKMSSDFVGYHQLLCYPNPEEHHKMLDLTLYMPHKPEGSKATANKARSYIVLYSPLP